MCKLKLQKTQNQNTKATLHFLRSNYNCDEKHEGRIPHNAQNLQQMGLFL